MKKLKKVLCLILALALLSSVCLTAGAAEPRASYYLGSYTTYGYDYGGGHISVWFEVCGVETMDEIGALTIILQERASSADSWTTVETFLHTENPDMLSYTDAFFAGHVDYYDAVPGYQYQAYVTIWAGKNGGGDSRDLLTPIFQAS